MKKKLCFFNLDLDVGGVERQLVSMSRRLNRNKYDVSLVLCENKGEFLEYVFPQIKTEGLGFKYSVRAEPLIALRLFRFLLNHRPDIFISFHSKLHHISVLVCALLSIRVFCCFEGYVYKGKLNFLRDLYRNIYFFCVSLWLYIRPFQKFKGYFYKGRFSFLNNLYRVYKRMYSGLRSAERIIPCSEGVRSSLVKVFKTIDNRKICVIENAVDIQEISSFAEEEISQGQLFSGDTAIVIAVGRLVAVKGFDILIKAVPFIKNNCKIVIVGDGPQRSYLEGLAQRLKVGDQVLFLGNKKNPFKYLKKARLFILSSYSEGLPLAILEAQVLGVPCICTDYKGGVQEVITHNVTGYVVEPGNAISLAKAIDLLLEDTKLLELFKQKGLENIRRNFYLERYLEQFEELFDNESTKLSKRG
ncbi:MAG: glycosyltransferase [Candidatus Omnitrophica bacterium]|nr:glycosyltransferase [Candidatus Omnitrophota bacterium]